jgi:hypothetical protein
VEPEREPLPALAPSAVTTPGAGPVVAEPDGPSWVTNGPPLPGPASVDSQPRPAPSLGGAADPAFRSGSGLIPELDYGPTTITMGRKTFLLGLGVVLASLAVLAVLWQTAGGDDGAETVAPIPDSDGVVVDTGETDALTAALADQTSRADAAEGRASALEGQVADLEQQLAAQPIPALPASALARAIVSTDAQFVSATDTSVAVVGPFGGYANIDPATGAVTASGQIGTEATRVLRTPTTVWATNFTGNELVRLDPVTNQVVGQVPFPGPDGLTKFGDGLLVASFSEGFVGLVDPNAGTITSRADVGGDATAVAASDAWIYAAVFDTGEVVKIDPATFTVVDRVIVGAGPVGLALGEGDQVWVTNRTEGTVASVDFATGEVFSIPVGAGPVEVQQAFGSLWVAVSDDGELVQIDMTERKVVTRTPLGGSPTGLSVGAGSLWVGVAGDRSVVRVTL